MPIPSADDAPGWHAIDSVLEPIYGDQEPSHWGTLVSFRLGGRDPLDGISAYRHEDPQGGAHWHYVSYGMSELYTKESQDLDHSGWGFEFTFRLRIGPGETAPPQWALGLLQNLARYVFQSGNVFAPGHYIPLNGPIAIGVETEIHAALFAEDPKLGSIKTPNGKMQFVQIVGATMDELAAGRAWAPGKLLDAMQATNPLLVTDLRRGSSLHDPEFARIVKEGTERDGSGTGSLAVSTLEAQAEGLAKESLTILLGATAIEDFKSLLRGRTLFDRPFLLSSKSVALHIEAAAATGWKRRGDHQYVLLLSREAAIALIQKLEARRGDYQLPEIPHITFRIQPIEIKDADGKTVKTVG